MLASRQSGYAGSKAIRNAPAVDWEPHRPVITRLYKFERKSLKEVMTFMAKRYGFIAS